VQAHGLGSRTYNLSIQVPVSGVSVRETGDNQAILKTLQDQYRLITGKYLPSVVRWLQV
jgi:hypothetical protein